MIDHNRREERTQTSIEAMVFLNGEALACRVINISAHGAKISYDPETVPGDHVSLSFEPFGSIKGLVAWNGTHSFGIAFDDSQKAVEDVLMGLATYAMV